MPERERELNSKTLFYEDLQERERERERENKERDRDIETKTKRQTEKIERAKERSYYIYKVCVWERTRTR